MLKSLRERDLWYNEEESCKWTEEDCRNETYKKEVKEIIKKFKESITKCNTNLWENVLTQVVPEKIYLPKDYSNLIFSNEECHILKEDEKKPEGVLTMADGGAIPCVMLSILNLFIKNISLEEFGKTIVENGYRVDDQVLHSVMDVLIPYKFRLQTYLIQDVQEIYLGLKKNRPTLALVPADYLSKTDEKNEQAIAIIGYIDEKFILITPSEKTIITRKAEEIIPQIQKAWIIGI